jgi:hypothetical protein
MACERKAESEEEPLTDRTDDVLEALRCRRQTNRCARACREEKLRVARQSGEYESTYKLTRGAGAIPVEEMRGIYEHYLPPSALALRKLVEDFVTTSKPGLVHGSRVIDVFHDRITSSGHRSLASMPLIGGGGIIIAPGCIFPPGITGLCGAGIRSGAT